MRAILSEIARGNSVILTYRNKNYAKIIPCKKQRSLKLEKDAAFGMWKDNERIKSVKNYIDEIRGI